MFALTRKTEYALIALCHMAQNPDGLCSARAIADRFHVPASLLMNVLKTLSHGAFVNSIRGAKGGYQLAMAASEITLEDIITAIEGPIRFVHCAGHQVEGETPCDLIDVCPVKSPVNRIHDSLAAFLRRITLSDIVHDMKTCETCVPLSLEGETVARH